MGWRIDDSRWPESEGSRAGRGQKAVCGEERRGAWGLHHVGAWHQEPDAHRGSSRLTCLQLQGTKIALIKRIQSHFAWDTDRDIT